MMTHLYWEGIRFLFFCGVWSMKRGFNILILNTMPPGMRMRQSWLAA